ncbi:nitrate ABC transporter substrate-binding protein [Clostridia bacterium]|nr:nitrate ABC transporter substrate-binding protein [Clostridia bacterium]
MKGMKRKRQVNLRILTCIVIVIYVSVFCFACMHKQNASQVQLTDVRLIEVAHSVFYAPQYVAIEEGYFQEEGINLKLQTGAGADKAMVALLTGEADIGLMGSEATIYTYQEGATDYAINFAQLTNRAGNFLVGRSKEDDFKWSSLRGKTVLGGRPNGMPEMILEYILKKTGVHNPQEEVNLITNIDFGLTIEAFASGTGDYTVEFEPYASSLESSGKGYVVASLGVDSGYVPYTAYSARKSYLENHEEILEKFTRAIQKGLDYVNEHTAEEVAECIQGQFEETSRESLTQIVDRYQLQNTWKNNCILEEDSFLLLQNILEDAKVLEERIPYETLVNTKFAQMVQNN